MASRRAIANSSQAHPLLAARNARHSNPWSICESQRARCIAGTYLDKVATAEARWAERAEKIETGEIPHTWDVLNERGYIKDFAGTPNRIKEIMRTKRIGAYVGIDPTADSLHVGHLLPLMPLFLMWFHGYPAVTLIGGATARIGDPTGRLQSREIMSNSEISKNIYKMHYQLGRMWRNAGVLRMKYGYEKDWAAKHRLMNNNMWLQGLSMYDFTKRLLRHSRMGPLLSRETVKRKMTDGDGMSVSEFLYPLFQGWDFWHMYNKLGVQMQIGGSDQYGNIITGIDVIQTVRESEEAPEFKMPGGWQNEPLGFTVPLITDGAGNKLGKSAGNAVWCDPFKTSPFEFYGYFMRRTDEEVESWLKMFTFMPLSQIESIMTEHRLDPTKRVAQHYLAFEVSCLVHGSERALQEAQQHSFRFGGKLPEVFIEPTEESGMISPNTAPRSDMTLPRSVLKLSPARILRAIGFAKSSSEAHELVTKQGAYIAGQPGQMTGLVPGNLSWTPMKNWFPEETNKFVIDDRLIIFRKGKRNIRIVELVSDAEWQESGKIYDGQPFTGKVRQMKEQLKKEAQDKGERLSRGELSEAMQERFPDEDLTVANNPDIKLPTKQEVRERARQQKAESKNEDQEV